MNHDHFMMQEEPDFQFCPVCGGRLETSRLKENEPERLVCSHCQFIFYLDPKLVVSSVVELDGGIVLLRRGIEPQKGKWVVPGGYVDRGEAVEVAALRETEEECGIRTRIKKLLGVYSYPGRAVVVAVYVTEYLTGDLTAGEEALEVRQFRVEEIPWDDLAFPSTKDALKDYCHLRDVSG